jgi:hypothetical protein
MSAAAGRGRLRRGLLGALLAPGALCALGCKGSDVPVGVSDPENVLDESAWAQVLIFEGACPSIGDVVRGTYQESVNYEQTADAGEGFDDIGALDAGPLGFALVARSSTCQIIGVGCTNANLRKVDRVDIVVGRVYDSTARTACEPTSTCVEGQCVAAGTDETGAGADGPGGR